MNITDPLVLRNDVVLVPVTELPAEVRAKIDFVEGDYAVSRLHGRMPSQIVDVEIASLLEEFREPTTIVDAVIRNSRTLSRDPKVWLDELLPFLGIFLRNRVLAPAGDEEEPEMRPRLEPGAHVDGWEVLRCVNLIEDSELYRVRKDGVEGALKIAREAVPFPGSVYANEIAVLQHLGGSAQSSVRSAQEQEHLGDSAQSSVRSAQEQEPEQGAQPISCAPRPALCALLSVPRLLDHGLHEDRPWLVGEWREGADAGVATSSALHDRLALLELCVMIADAYTALHDRGVIHADVHPRNVLIAPGPRVTLIDFGLSRIDGSTLPLMPRGGMYYFFEPEYLESLHGPRQLEATYAGEQYALAALLYLILTGKHYLDFRFDRDEMMRQSRTEPPLPFTQRGLPPWPDVEAILGRALEKDPALRFASVREMADALRAAHAKASADMPAPSDAAMRLVDEELASLDYPTAPHASINYGAAGAAVGVLRIAEARGDAKLLALAEVWRTRAAAFIGVREGWYAEEHDVPETMIGRVTPYHTASGLHAAAALIAYARGDSFAQQRTTLDFIRASQAPCEQIDLTLGRCGTLLASALLLERGSEEVRALGDGTLAEVWTRLDALPPLREQPAATYLGMAHGWSGFLYATLRWCTAAGTALPVNVERRLHELADQRVARGRGAYWPRTMAGGIQDMMSGWCNGAAGHVFLWTAAHDALRDTRWLGLAREAAWNAWEEPLYSADLCCGSAGRAYALLNLYQHTGEREWLARARHLANHAADTARESPQRTHALWKGELGVAVLIADLDSPEEARMPLFA